MLTLKPFGARIFVVDIPPVDEVTARASKVGLYTVVDKRNQPQPTSGVCVAVGSDPLIQETVHVDDTVFFKKYAGTGITIEGKEFRSLEIDDIITTLCPHPTPSAPTSQQLSEEELELSPAQKSSQLSTDPERSQSTLSEETPEQSQPQQERPQRRTHPPRV